MKSLRLHWMLASDSLQLQRERMAKVVPWQGAVVILLVTALQAIPLRGTLSVLPSVAFWAHVHVTVGVVWTKRGTVEILSPVLECAWPLIV